MPTGDIIAETTGDWTESGKPPTPTPAPTPAPTPSPPPAQQQQQQAPPPPPPTAAYPPAYKAPMAMDLKMIMKLLVLVGGIIILVGAALYSSGWNKAGEALDENDPEDQQDLWEESYEKLGNGALIAGVGVFLCILFGFVEYITIGRKK